MLAGGSLSGTFRGADGSDSFQSDNLPNLFGIFGPTSGFATGLGQFVEVETLLGNAQSDDFLLFAAPYAGSIDGQAGTDSIWAGSVGLNFQLTGADSGTIDGVTSFTSVENLHGGSADDSFLIQGGTLSGSVTGGSGSDTLVADNLPNNFQITGANSGTLVGATLFSEIENLTGGNQPDCFVFNPGGTISGTLDGADGNDCVTAANLPINVFSIDELDGGTLNGVGRFTRVESLTGNAQSDYFWLKGGTLSGSIDGQGGNDVLLGDNLPSSYTIDGPDSGQATGLGAGFVGVEFLQGGNDADAFVVTATGSLTGFLLGSDGDDTFAITPALGATFSVFGGSGQDRLTVDAQTGLPTLVPPLVPTAVTVAPGGAIVSFAEVEVIRLECTSCPAPLPAVAAGGSKTSSAQPTRGLRRGARTLDDTAAALDGAARAAIGERGLLPESVHVGHFTTSGSVRMGFLDMAHQLQRQHRAQTLHLRARRADRAFAEDCPVAQFVPHAWTGMEEEDGPAQLRLSAARTPQHEVDHVFEDSEQDWLGTAKRRRLM